jgi:hypothetical protein
MFRLCIAPIKGAVIQREKAGIARPNYMENGIPVHLRLYPPAIIIHDWLQMEIVDKDGRYHDATEEEREEIVLLLQVKYDNPSLSRLFTLAEPLRKF